MEKPNTDCCDCGAPFPTHASITFGVFLCELCAEEHKKELGMEESFIKSLDAYWYGFQLKFVSPGVGGNKPFLEHMKQHYDKE